MLRGHDHIGVTPQTDGVHSAIGLCVPIGRLTSGQFTTVLDLADRYGTGEIRLTHQQNILIPHVPNEMVDGLLSERLVLEERDRFRARGTDEAFEGLRQFIRGFAGRRRKRGDEFGPLSGRINRGNMGTFGHVNVPFVKREKK